jgi:dTDP-4-amino-4,6-dideoxygalactose transaminase
MKVPFLDLHAAYLEQKSALDAAYRRVMDSGYFILGSECEAFEAEFARFTGTKFAIGVANGLDAIHLVLRALNIQDGDEVIVPAHTFIATWLAVSHAGATVVPVEPTSTDWNIDTAQILEKVTTRTKAVIIVHLYGNPVDISDLNTELAQKGIALIEDAAQAHGAAIRDRSVGAFGAAACFSFYPGKNLGAIGDGGAIVTNNLELADRIRELRNYGSKKKYHHEVIGFNSRLDELQSAFLRVKLLKLDEWNNRRRKIASQYHSKLSALSNIQLLTPVAGASPVWHLYPVLLENRDAIQQKLHEMEIATLIHYPVPGHLSGAYKNLFKRGDFPVTEKLSSRLLSLPIGPHQNERQTSLVIEALIQLLG